MPLNFSHAPIRGLISLSLAFLLIIPDALRAATPQAPAPTQLNLIIVEGEGAINNIRQRTAREPIVQVEDENRRPIAGAAVLFVLPDSGPGGAFSDGARSLQVMTNSEGRAIAKGMRLNNIEGKFQIQVHASYKGVAANTVINQSNAVLAAAPAGGVSGKLIAILVAIGAAVAVGVVLATRDGDAPARSPNQPYDPYEPDRP